MALLPLVSLLLVGAAAMADAQANVNFTFSQAPPNVEAAPGLPAGFASWTAVQKQQYQWQKIVDTQFTAANNYLPNDIPQASRPGQNLSLLVYPPYLTQKFTWFGDEMPEGHDRMYIGPYSDMCTVNFTAYRNSTNKYTGLFYSGGVGVIRFSLNAIFGVNSPHDVDTFTCLTSTKIYVDGTHSQSWHTVNGTLGQAPDRNYFHYDMTTHFKLEAESIGSDLDIAFEQCLAILPGGEMDRPIGTNDAPMYEPSQIYSNGTLVQGPIIAPFELILRPSPAIQFLIPADSKNDFRVDINKVLTPGALLYTVMGRRSSLTDEPELIGDLTLTSKCLPSDYGDRKVFFRHNVQRWRPQ